VLSLFLPIGSTNSLRCSISWSGSNCNHELLSSHLRSLKKLNCISEILYMILITRINAMVLFQRLHWEKPNMPISSPTSRSQQWRVARTPPDGLDRCPMLIELHHFASLFLRVHYQLVIITSRCNVVPFWTPFQSTDLLIVGTVLRNQTTTTEIPGRYLAIFGPAG
jgi:hypothetical protein